MFETPPDVLPFDIPETRGRKPVYDWATILDGKPRRYTHGEHFNPAPHVWAVSVYKAAKRRGEPRPRVHVSAADGTVDVQGQPVTVEDVLL
jgi:hypothetical protein